MGKAVLFPSHASIEYQSKAYTAAKHFLDAFLLPRIEKASIVKITEVEQLSFVFLQRNPQFIDCFHLIQPLNLALQRLKLDPASPTVQQAHDLLARTLLTGEK